MSRTCVPRGFALELSLEGFDYIVRMLSEDFLIPCRRFRLKVGLKVNALPYSIPSVGPGADPGVYRQSARR